MHVSAKDRLRAKRSRVEKARVFGITLPVAKWIRKTVGGSRRKSNTNHTSEGVDGDGWLCNRRLCVCACGRGSEE